MELANKNLNIIKFLGSFAVFVSLFPWVGFNLLDTDSQPWPLIFFTTFLFVIPKKIVTPKDFYLLILIIIIGIIISIFQSNTKFSFLTVRGMYGYISFLIIFIGFYNYLLRYGFPLKLFLVANFLWLAGGMIELVSPNILEFITPQRTSFGRGVTSFAPEPSFFAIYLFFSSWIILIAKKYEIDRPTFILLTLNILSFFILARSAMGILYLFISFSFISFYYLFRIRINKKILRSLIIGTIFFALLAIIFFPYLKENRYVELIIQLSSEINPFDIFYLDASMNERLQHIVFSIHGSVLNFLLPGGFDTFTYHQDYLINFYNNYFWYERGSLKITSWIGDWTYQIGIFGIIVLWYLFKITSDKTYKRLIERLLLFVILLSGIPVAFPMIAMILALFTYYKKINYYKK